MARFETTLATIGVAAILFVQPRITSGQTINCVLKGATTGIFFENDARWVTVADRSDDDYSAGTRFYRISPTGRSPRKRERWPFRQASNRCFSREYAIGISIYTPNEIDKTERLPDQRPYTGWTYLFRGVSAHDFDRDGFATSIQSFEVHFGIVGPGAGGEQFQNTIHRIAHIGQAKGWHNQLKNEPGIIVGYRRQNLIAKIPQRDDSNNSGLRWLDANVGWAGEFGNVLTYAEGLTGLRIGLNISNDIGPVQRIDQLPRERDSVLIKQPRCEVYGFVEVRGRWVGRNISLDGNLFRDTPQKMDKKPIFGEIEGGAVVRLWRAQATWRTVVRGAEFDLQNRLQKYGSLTLAYRAF
jgi:lipid A 3-O-deacylase